MFQSTVKKLSCVIDQVKRHQSLKLIYNHFYIQRSVSLLKGYPFCP